MQSHGDVWKAARVRRLLPQPRLGSGVGEDVCAFGGADVGGHRDDRHAGDQAARHRQHGRGSRGREHRDALRARHPLGDGGGGADQIAAAQHRSVDAHRIADVGASRHCRGVQRGQQHDREDTGLVDWIETVGSREIYRNNWLTLREDDIRRPDGSDGIYAVVDKPTYALVIALDGDRLHLVEQFRYPLGLRRWEFPQGTAPDRISSRQNSPRGNCARRRACGRRR